ncbi:hypothetical protein L596_000206 [Steinernema carpocapsae]|uniref:Uncharacterized protein n=1 Tax=Steinernema carpocapsae TaxID=34508 RepID=A0A4U8UHL0_STECR|nr:hypothetical protein L596_000206 [Steinernema carpocapsae]
MVLACEVPATITKLVSFYFLQRPRRSLEGEPTVGPEKRQSDIIYVRFHTDCTCLLGGVLSPKCIVRKRTFCR